MTKDEAPNETATGDAPLTLTAKARPQDGLHNILKNIRYHNPDHELNGKLVRPSDGVQLPFPHLDDVGYQLLIRTRTIAPAKG